MVEDNPADVFLIRESIADAMPADVHVLDNGEKAIQFFERADADDSIQCPDLVILDINLPKKSGGLVLLFLRQTKRCLNTRVLIVTSSNSLSDREAMQRYGADRYFRKPSAFAEFLKLGEVVQELLNWERPVPSD